MQTIAVIPRPASNDRVTCYLIGNRRLVLREQAYRDCSPYCSEVIAVMADLADIASPDALALPYARFAARHHWQMVSSIRSARELNK